MKASMRVVLLQLRYFTSVIVYFTYVPVNSEGCVSHDDVVAAITKYTILVTLMLANNESGALQPVKSVTDYCQMNSNLFHKDAAQAVGKVSVAMDPTEVLEMESI